MSVIDLVNEGVDLFNSGQLQESLSKYDSAISLNPNCKEAYLNKGIVLNSLNSISEAIQNFEQCLKLFPNYPSALIGLGNSHLISGNFKKALEYFEQALKVKDKLHLALEGKCICLYELNQKEEANKIIEELNKENNKEEKNEEINNLIKGNIAKDENNFEEAINYYDKCIEQNKNCYEAYYNKALCEISLNQNEDALNNLDMALNIKKDFPQALDAKGCRYYSNNQYNEALECYNELTEKYNTNDDYFYKKASTLIELKRYKEAIKSLDDVLKLNPDHIKAMILKGNCYDFLSLNKEALEIYEQIILKDKDNELVHQLKGQNLLKQKEYENALNEFDIVINLNPKNYDVFFYKAICLNKLNKKEKAIEFYKKYIQEMNELNNEKEKENICVAYYNIGIIYMKDKKNEEAKDSFNKALELNPKFIKAKIALDCLDDLNNKINEILELIDENKQIEDDNLLLIKSNLLYEKGLFNEANTAYQKLLEKNPNNEEALLGIANCLYKLNKKEEALKKYDEVLEINKINQLALFNKALIILENGNIEESLKLLDEALKIKTNINILIQKGICLLKKENFEESNSIFDEAINLDQTNIKAHIGKGQALFGLNKINESIEEYDKALNLDPNNKNAICSKANSLMRNGQKEEALELYQKGIDFNNDEKINCMDLINYIFCLIEMKKMDEVKDNVDTAEKLYQKQKLELSEKERNFFEKNIEKVKRKNKRLFK